MTKVTIFKKNIDNKFWLKFLFTITYIKNNYATKVFHFNISSYKTKN